MNKLSTQITNTRFAQLFNQVLAATVANNADAALLSAKQQVYFESLLYHPQWALEEAAKYLIETESFFPPVAKWIAAINLVVESKLRDTLKQPREWKLHCETCRDTGWRSHQCANGARCGREFCARHDEADIAYEHEYLSPCVCREHNPSYQREVQYTRAQAMLRGKTERGQHRQANS